MPGGYWLKQAAVESTENSYFRLCEGRLTIQRRTDVFLALRRSALSQVLSSAREARNLIQIGSIKQISLAGQTRSTNYTKRDSRGQ